VHRKRPLIQIFIRNPKDGCIQIFGIERHQIIQSLKRLHTCACNYGLGGLVLSQSGAFGAARTTARRGLQRCSHGDPI
jgi:hypothetical protein